MESTAQYWRPVWEALELHWRRLRRTHDGASPTLGTLHLAQAQSNRGTGGRKRDFPDAERLVKRLVAQELTLSFVPDAEQRLWRTVMRRKYQITRNRVQLHNRLESLLEEAHIKVSSIVSDLLGTSARRMLHALAEGETDPQLFQRELQQPTVDRMQRRARLEGIAQLRRRRAQARVRQRRQGDGIRLAIRQRLQHASCAGAQQIRDEAGQLDVRFLEQRLQPVVELHAVARDLVLAPHHGPPEPLLGVGHETQGQLLRDQALHQPFRIRKVLLPPAGATIRLRLCKMERAREARPHRRAPGARAPVLLQRLPHRSPVLRGRFHHDFLDLALDQPVGERAQLAGVGPDLQPFKVEVAFDLDVGHHDGQHLLVHVNPRDPVRHRPLLVGAESVPRRISQGRELSPAPARTRRRSIIRSITHAPDQTVARPRLLHG